MADEDYDYVTKSDEIARQKRLAEVLRKYQLDQFQKSIPVSNQMVGGRYINSPLQIMNAGLRSGVDKQLADQAEAEANRMSGAYQQQVTGAQRQWQQGLPQTVPGHAELPGPQAEGGSPELAAQPAQIPNRSQVLSATLRGIQIPGNEKEAELWNRGMQEEQTREDRQAEAQSVLKATLAQRQEQFLAEQQRKRDDATDKAFNQARDDAEKARHNKETEENARQLRATNEAIAKGHDAARIAAKAGSDKADAADKRDIYKNLGSIGTKMKPLVPVIGAAREIQKMIDSYTNDDGTVRDIPGIGRTGMIPATVLSAGVSAGLLDESTNPNRAKVADLVGAIMRNQAGLSQTIAEAKRVMEKTLTSGEYKQSEFLENWINLVRAINEDQDLIQQTHRPEAIELFQKNGGKFEHIRSGKTSDTDKRLEELRAKKKAAGG